MLHINPMMRWLILIGGIVEKEYSGLGNIYLHLSRGIFFSSSIQSQDLPTNTFVEQFHRFVKYFFWYSWNWIHTIHTYPLYHLYHHHIVMFYDQGAIEVMICNWMVIMNRLMSQLWGNYFELSWISWKTIKYCILSWISWNIMNQHKSPQIIMNIMNYHDAMFCCWRVIMNPLMSQLSPWNDLRFTPRQTF